mgnify:CR=1 FL=1
MTLNLKSAARYLVKGVNMSWRRRRSFFDDFFREFFEEFEELERELQRIARRFSRLSPEELFERAEVRGPYVYGFSITIGPDGKPIIREFGNVRRIAGRPSIGEEREPLVDVFEDEKTVTVIAELPGVNKEDIKVKATDNILVISAQTGDRKYYKEIDLPAKVKPETARANYKNGVLEVKLEKVSKGEEKGFEIKIE